MDAEVIMHCFSIYLNANLIPYHLTCTDVVVYSVMDAEVIMHCFSIYLNANLIPYHLTCTDVVVYSVKYICL